MRWTLLFCLAILLTGCERLFPPPIDTVCEHFSFADIKEVAEADAMTRGTNIIMSASSSMDSTLTATFMRENDYFYIDQFSVSEGHFLMLTGWFLISNRRIDHDGTCLVDGDTLYVRRTR